MTTDQTDHPAEAVQAVAEVVGIHDALASIPDEGCECSCGATITTNVESYAVGLWREHQAEEYVAAAGPHLTREAKAERDTLAARLAAEQAATVTYAQEVSTLAARLAAVEALAKYPESILEHIGGGNLVTHRRMVSVDDLRAALATGTTNQEEADQ